MASRQSKCNETDVLIVGAGPVGMTLALDLSRRGVAVTIVEKRARDDEPRKRCNHLSARSMEIYRSLGLADELRRAGLPPSHPHDAAYVTALNGYELARVAIPSSENAYSETGHATCGWPTPEPPHRCNQLYWEPILQQRVLAAKNITIDYNMEIDSIQYGEYGVHATGIGLDGEHGIYRASYLVGCDGGSSLVRKTIGARFEGDEVISGTRSVYFRSTDLVAKRTVNPAWQTWFITADHFGCIIAMNGIDLWGAHFFLPAGPPDFSTVDVESALVAVVGEPFDFEIVSQDDWYARRLISDKFRDGCVFICGDASHIWIPFAGYGMNAGIADAGNLAWQLAATIQGWGGADLLDTYEAERRRVTEQVSHQVMKIALDNIDTDLVRRPPSALFTPGPDGDTTRKKVGNTLYEANYGQFVCAGLNFGSYYDASPIIAEDQEGAPPYSLTRYTPSTVPGCRTPHAWLPSGESLYDAMLIDGYTLIRTDPGIDVSALQVAARQRNVPLIVLDLADEAATEYPDNLVLSRSDQHVAWRGDALPHDCGALVDLVRGASTSLTSQALSTTTRVAQAAGKN